MADITRMAPLRRIQAGVLDVAFFEAGPADGPPVLLMHGFPYDIHSYAEVAPLAPGWRDRVALWQLYPLAVHALLFGGGYGGQVARILAALV